MRILFKIICFSLLSSIILSNTVHASEVKIECFVRMYNVVPDVKRDLTLPHTFTVVTTGEFTFTHLDGTTEDQAFTKTFTISALSFEDARDMGIKLAYQYGKEQLEKLCTKNGCNPGN